MSILDDYKTTDIKTETGLSFFEAAAKLPLIRTEEETVQYNQLNLIGIIAILCHTIQKKDLSLVMSFLKSNEEINEDQKSCLYKILLPLRDYLDNDFTMSNPVKE